MSNRAMMDAMDEIFKVDVEMRKACGDPIPYEMAHLLTINQPPPPPAINNMRVAGGNSHKSASKTK